MVFLCFILSYTTPKENQEQRKIESKTISEIKTTTLTAQPFPLQLTTNGIIKAQQQTQLYFKAIGEIAQINISNTLAVRQGQVLAVLDNRQAEVAILQAQDQIKKAGFTLNTCQSRF